MKIQINISTPSPPFFFLLLLLLLLLIIPFPSSSSTANWYTSCGKTFNCGVLPTVDYPFWGGDRPKECGHPDLQLNCNSSLTTITILKVDYRVLLIDQPKRILTIKRNDLAIGDICPAEFINTTFESSLFEHASNYINLTIQYGCPPLLNIPVSFPILQTCTVNGITYQNNYIGPTALMSGTCRESIVIPVQSSSYEGIGLLSNLGKFIEGGFEMRWKVDTTNCDECKSSGGRCGFDLKSNRFVCVCPESDQSAQGYKKCSGGNSAQLHSLTPASGSKGTNTPTTIVLPIAGAVLFGIGFGWLIFFCRQRKKRLALRSKELSTIDTKELPTTPLTKKEINTSPSIAFTKSIPSFPLTKTDFGIDTSYFGAKVFSYNELQEATENFAEARELGDGGFGAVYYGTLSDGRIVAVKRLYENNYKRVEQFMNEVEILTRLRHSNLVTLFGCTSKQSRELLLVYEYIPNGTVADHLHGKLAKSGLLSWSVRLNIAIETAKALAYLHALDIIHRDVKTTNILLENDFHVKVADFGLSRLFPLNATHVSTAPQGTPGYVDPDYHQCYQLTEKSDVYSFGVVLIELISSLPAVDTNRHRHDINLSNMAINKIQNHRLHELVDPSLQFEANSSIRRMITSVAELAFRCLQQEKDMRPTMQEVLDILNAQKIEVVTIVVDDGRRLLKDNTSPLSPDSVTAQWDSGSITNSCG